jgi:hypothetical protein
METDQDHGIEASGHFGPEYGDTLFWLGLKATRAAGSLESSWLYADRPINSADIDSLKKTLALDASCHNVLRDQPLLLAPKSIEQRFRLRAGALMVYSTVPFSLPDRDQLFDELTEGLRTNDQTFYMAEWLPGFSAKNQRHMHFWHDWLRMDGVQPAKAGSHNYGEATLLYEAALSLAQTVHRITGRGSQPAPGHYQQTSFGPPRLA